MMEMVIEVFITLLITYENGFKANGKVKHKVNRLPFMREDITREEILSAVEVMRPVMVGKIVAVDLETKKIKRLLTPEMRREKLEREGEEFETSPVQRAAVSTHGAAASVNAAPASTVGVQSTAAPVTTPIFPARDAGSSVFGFAALTPLGPASRAGRIKEEAGDLGKSAQPPSFLRRARDFFIDDSYRKKETEVKQLEKVEKLPYDMSYVDWSDTPTARLMRQFDEQRAQRPITGAEKKKAAEQEETAMPTKNISSGIPYRGNFMERMRANGFKITPEEFMPQKTTAHIGVAPKLEKIDVPVVYKDGP